VGQLNGAQEDVYWPYLCDDAMPAGATYRQDSADDARSAGPAPGGRDGDGVEGSGGGPARRLRDGDRDGDRDGNLDRAPRHHLVFYLSPTERTRRATVPHAPTALRLEKRFDGFRRTLYLHNAAAAKPESLARLSRARAAVTAAACDASSGRHAALTLAEVDARTKDAAAASHASELGSSLQLVFSTQKCAEDVFFAMPASADEAATVRRVLSLRPHVEAYTRWVLEPSSPLGAPDCYPSLCAVFWALIQLQAKGFSEEMDPKVDWVKRAAGLLPTAFSRLFSSGEPEPSAQNACRDLKIVDAVFHATVAPYARTYPHNGFRELSPAEAQGVQQLKQRAASGSALAAGSAEWLAEAAEEDRPALAFAALHLEMKGCKAVQKFAHVALQRMAVDNPATQRYFGARLGPCSPALAAFKAAELAKPAEAKDPKFAVSDAGGDGSSGGGGSGGSSSSSGSAEAALEGGVHLPPGRRSVAGSGGLGAGLAGLGSGVGKGAQALGGGVRSLGKGFGTAVASGVLAGVALTGRALGAPQTKKLPAPVPYARWMDSLTAQLEDPLGAAVTLAALLSASEALMKAYATAAFV
jgi:hypothetical protein